MFNNLYLVINEDKLKEAEKRLSFPEPLSIRNITESIINSVEIRDRNMDMFINTLKGIK